MKLTLLFFSLFLLFACNSEKEIEQKQEIRNNQALNVPDGFDYKMDRDITLQLQVFDHNGTEAQQVGIKVYEPSKATTALPSDSAPVITDIPSLIFSGQTNSLGYLEESVVIPMHLEKIEIQVSQVGINNSVLLPLNNNVIFYEFK